MSAVMDRPGGTPDALAVDESDLRALLEARHSQPHSVLGVHPISDSECLVRAFHPEACGATCVPEDGPAVPMQSLGAGLFGAVLSFAKRLPRYRLKYDFPDAGSWEGDDAYRFLPTLGEQDLHYFGEGTHKRLWEVMGARRLAVDDVDGVAFAVWAPNAARVSVVGDFCHFDGRVYPMRALGGSGVFELFIPGVRNETNYKFEILGADGRVTQRADPFADACEHRPKTASRVFQSCFEWGDGDWMRDRASRDVASEPMAVYEVHLGSWARHPDDEMRVLGYREIAPRLVEHAKRFGFSHLELLPVSEFPFDGSWGYQVTGYFAPTSRFGNPDDFRFFVDYCHRHGIGVILDWVPAHFPKDEFALRRFDGTALFEHADPRQGEHPDWGTLIFNYSRAEVSGFLIASGLHWLDRFHVDGLRVDAVASMLYLDYSREEGDWIANIYGGRENLEAIDFLREMNGIVSREYPGCFTVAEESTAWPGVTAAVEHGGLGFTFKWNMGWMHDTLTYFSKDPVHRRFHQDDLSFAMIYERHERFVMPLSHDEVVHGKGSLFSKMAGDDWQKMANLRAMLTYMYTRPGKKLLFMGAELAVPGEWDATRSLDWGLLSDPQRARFAKFFEDLGGLYLGTPSLWERDYETDGFDWIDLSDRENCVLSYERRSAGGHVVVVMNLTPVPRYDYRLGVPAGVRYEEIFSSDRPEYGGSHIETPSWLTAEQVPMHGKPQSICLTLAPLSVAVLTPRG
jgi:1,4-alpha-glucan branching enzyme